MSLPKDKIELTRESLCDGSLHRWIATADPKMRLRSDTEHLNSIRQMLAARQDGGGDVWIFAYGSLIWNPTIETEERRRAEVKGFHRRFCLWTHLGRGTADCPGLTLALEPGGSCCGVAYRIAEAKAEHELLILWRREMLTGAYQPRWVKAVTKSGPVCAVTFVVNASHERYAGRLAEARVAEAIAHAHGALGHCYSYLFSTVRHLRELGIRDRYLEAIAGRVDELRVRETPAQPGAAP